MIEFKIGDIVKIATTSEFYSDLNVGKPKCEGIIFNTTRSSGQGYNIEVRWADKQENVYRKSDLVLLKSKVIKSTTIMYDIGEIEEQLLLEYGKEDTESILNTIKQIIK